MELPPQPRFEQMFALIHSGTSGLGLANRGFACLTITARVSGGRVVLRSKHFVARRQTSFTFQPRTDSAFGVPIEGRCASNQEAGRRWEDGSPCR
jgi:hypothetical protein